MNPLDIIEKGLKINPTITKILFPGVVLIACVALAVQLVSDWQTALFGAILFTIAIVVLLVIAVIANRPDLLGSIAQTFAWFVFLLFALMSLTLFTAMAFGWPKPLPCLINPIKDCSPPRPAEAAPAQISAICLRPDQRLPSSSCGQVEGKFVVTNVRSDDGDHGLHVRDKPDLRGISLGLLPLNATEVIVGACKKGSEDDRIWCPVQCKSLIGWSRDRYLTELSSALYSVVGISQAAPALGVRNGPDQACSAVDSIPANSRDLVLHVCQFSSNRTSWCLVTYNKRSGWVPAENLQRQF